MPHLVANTGLTETMTGHIWEDCDGEDTVAFASYQGLAGK
jgi:hypothetical protein